VAPGGAGVALQGTEVAVGGMRVAVGGTTVEIAVEVAVEVDSPNVIGTHSLHSHQLAVVILYYVGAWYCRPADQTVPF
jgi:hypothetical protein